MGREKKPKEAPGLPLWLVTYSDLVTLLLTFFVMLLAMSSMDKSVLVRVNFFSKDIAAVHPRGAGQVSQRIRMLIELLENPWDVLEKQNRIKDLLFPDDELPKDINVSDLVQNLQILQRPEGVALVLSDKLLFKVGGHELSDSARVVLDQVAEVLGWMDADVNISGHSDDREGAGEGEEVTEAYLLSGLRAMAVLDYFIQTGYLEQKRFSVSGYGPNWPMADNTTTQGRERNRRVEVLVKTTPYFAGYRL